MKKIMFFLIAALFVFSAAFAQTKTAPASVANPIEVTQDDATSAHLALPAIKNNPPSRAPGDIVFYEDFNATTFPPSGWTINAVTGSGTWARATSAPLVDGIGGYAYRADVSGSNQETWLISSAITIPATGSYTLDLMSYVGYSSYYTGGGSGSGLCRIWVSTTNNSIGSFSQFYTLAYGTDVPSTSAWVKISKSLSAYNGQTIYIAFVYTGGYDHNWRVDNVTVLEPADNDLTITSAKYPYSQIPQSQNLTQAFDVAVKNNGKLAQNNIALDVAFNSTSIGTASQATLASGATATLNVSATALPILLGDNTLKFEVTQTETDQLPGDNIVTRNFKGTNFTFANDAGDEAYTTVFGSTTSAVTAGNVYTFTKPTTVYQAQFFSYSGYSATTLNFNIYSMPTATTTSSSAIYTQSSIARPAATQWNNLNLTTPQTLAPGSYYFAFTQTSSSGHMSILGDANNEGRVAYTRSGTTLTAQTASMMLRLNVDLPSNNLVLTANGFPYTQIPLSQAADLPFPALTGKALNLGSTAQNNVTLSGTYNGTPIGSSTPILSLASLATSAEMSVTPVAGTVFPTTLGTNTVVYTVSQDETDDDFSDNTQTFTFDMTNDIFAVDAVTPLTDNGVGGGAKGARLGNNFTIAKTTSLTQVIISFNSSPLNVNYNILLYTRTGNTIPTTPIMTQSAVRPAGGGWVTVTVPTTLMTPGDYFLCVQETTDDELIGINYDGVVGRPCGYSGTETGTTLYPQANFGSLAIRMVIAEPVYVTITTNVTPTGAGTVTGGGSCLVGGIATLTATANMGYLFQQWSDGVTDNPRKVNVTGNETYTAVFEVFPMDACTDGFIGNGTTTSYHIPAENYSNRGYTQQIYSAAELGLTFPFVGNMLINSIAFKFSSSVTWTNQAIYLGNTTKSSFTADDDWVPMAELKKVYEGSISYTNAPWTTIPLQTPFAYTGGNIVVAYVNNHGSYTGFSGYLFSAHTETNKALYYGIDEPNTTFTPTGTETGTRPALRNNIQLNACGVLPYSKDLEVLSITGNTSPMALYPSDYVVTVKNNGSLTANNYKVSIVTDDNEELATETVTIPLTALNSYAVTLSITFVQTQAGAMNLKGVVTLVGDEIPNNNEKSLAINVESHPGYEIDCTSAVNYQIPTTSGTTGVYLYPINCNAANSYVQELFPLADLASIPAGSNIGSISFQYTNGTAMTRNNISIYLGYTNTTSFAGQTLNDFIPVANLTQVVKPRTITMSNASGGWNTIEFDVPFTYDGTQGLVLAFLNNSNTTGGGTTNRFYANASATGSNYRTLHTYRSTAFDLNSLTGTSTTARIQNYNNIRFNACDKQYTLNPLNYGDPRITLSPNNPITEGEEATITFTDDNLSDCLYIAEVLVDGIPVSNPYIIPSVIEPIPYFEIVMAAYEYTISASVTGSNGTISPAGNSIVKCGDATTYSIYPAAGYKVSTLTVDGVVKSPSTKYTFPANTDYNINHTIDVSFEICPFKIQFIKEGFGSIYQHFTSGDPYEILGDYAGVDYGLNHFTFVPDEHYKIQAIYIDGLYNMGATISGSYVFSNVTADHIIKVIFKLDEYVITAGSDLNGSITPSGNVSVPYGTNKQFKFTPNTGYVIDEVLVDNVSIPDSAAAGSYTFTEVDTTHTIFATFKKATVYLAAASTGGCGTVYPNGDAIPVTYNDTQIFTFVPTEGCKVSMVYVDGVPYPKAIATGSYTFYYVTEPHTLQVEFEKFTYPVTAQISDHGVINDAGTTYIDHGDSMVYNFHAMPGYKITNVFVDDIDNAAAVASGKYTFKDVKAPHIIDVIIAPELYTIKATIDQGGIMTPVGDIQVAYQGSQAFTFTTLPGYEINQVLVDDIVNIEAAENGAYAFVNVTTAHTIHVSLTLKRFQIMSSVQGEGGGIAPMGITELTFLDNITYTITPDQNYKIDYVLVNGENMGAIEAFTFSDVLANADIEAHFLYSPVGISNHTLEDISIYSRTNVVYIVNEHNLPISDVTIFDMYGRIVWQGVPQGNSITLNVANGIYTVRATSEDNFTVTKVPIVK